MSVLKLFFPQWQGSGGARSLYYGAHRLIDAYDLKDQLQAVNLSSEDDLRVEHGIIGYRQVLEQLKNVMEIIDGEKPEKIFTLGGDCATVLGPCSYLNQWYDGDLAMIWIDAHADLNTPASSLSQRFYGMPLRCLLGDGDEEVLEQCRSVLRPEQVVLVGLEDPDPAEVDYIRDNAIKVISANDLLNDAKALSDHVQTMGKRYVYIHMDLDVLVLDRFLDPDVIGYLAETLKAIGNHGQIVGFSAAGFSDEISLTVESLKPLLDIGLNL